MTWNHRVIKHVCDGEDWYGIHEVFYDDQGNPEGCTADAVNVGGEELDEIKQTLEWMMAATAKPILEMKMFEEMETKRSHAEAAEMDKQLELGIPADLSTEEKDDVQGAD